MKNFFNILRKKPSYWEQGSRTVYPELKAIFIHIPKTAGTSIHHSLDEMAAERMVSSDFDKLGKKLQHLDLSKHVKAADLMPVVGQARWDGCFSFTFVRNPWDLMVSSYEWWCQKAYKFKYLKEKAKEVSAFPSFTDYILSDYGQYMINEFAGNMTDWYCVDEVQVVDFVGKVENIDSDWAVICNALDVDVEKYRLPFANKSVRKPYQDYYTNETRQIIGDRFAPTIEQFEYVF